LWVWDDSALPSILNALHDDAWRVREMAINVVARHQLDVALPVIAELRSDPNGRVSRAAERAEVRLTDAGS
jgi:HEAT repeat protein